MQPLVPFVFHNLPSLYPPSFRRNDFLYLFYPFLTVPNAPSKTMLEYRCKREMLIPRFNAARGDRTRTAPLLRYDKPRIVHALYTLNFITRVRAGEVGVAHYPKWRRSLLIHAETRDFHSRRGMGERTIAW